MDFLLLALSMRLAPEPADEKDKRRGDFACFLYSHGTSDSRTEQGMDSEIGVHEGDQTLNVKLGNTTPSSEIGLSSSDLRDNHPEAVC